MLMEAGTLFFKPMLNNSTSMPSSQVYDQLGSVALATAFDVIGIISEAG